MLLVGSFRKFFYQGVMNTKIRIIDSTTEVELCIILYYDNSAPDKGRL